MSETTPHTNPPCEQLLDYVYGELDDAGKRAFEEHLAGCARCQAEAASFGRVRGATRSVMPAVEPSAPLTGALHAQLMHAAAQRTPRRGVLLGFPRKIVEHPAWAAAAMFVIVGGAIAINWSHDKMVMQASTPASEPVVPPPPLVPPVAPMAPMAKEKNQEQGTNGGASLRAADDQEATKIALEAPPVGRLTVQRPAPHRAPAPATPAAAPMPKLKSVAGKKDSPNAADADGLEDNTFDGIEGGVSGGGGPVSNRRSGVGTSGGRGGDAVGHGGRAVGTGHGLADAPAKSSAPQSMTGLGKAERQEQQSSRDRGPVSARATESAGASSQQAWTDRTAPAPAAATTAPPPPSQMVQSAEREGYARKTQTTSTLQKANGPGGDVEALRRRADEAARTGHCDDAIKWYQQLEKLSQYVSPTERANYVHCLTARGRQDEAQQQLDELKADKRVSNAQVQKVEEELTLSRRIQSKKGAAKKPAAVPADRAAQRRATESAPAEAAPLPAAEKRKAY